MLKPPLFTPNSPNGRICGYFAQSRRNFVPKFNTKNMNTKTYYLRHQWHSERFIFAPAARRVMDYIIENSTSYPRWVDGCFLPPGCIRTPRSRVCNDLGISLRDLVGAINTLGLYRHVRNHSYDSDILYVALLLDPDEITPPPVAETPPEVGAQYIAAAQPEVTHPKLETNESAPQSIAPAPPKNKKAPLAHPRSRGAIHCASPGTTSFKSPPPPAHSKTSVALDRPIISPSKPRRGALMFSPMWKHGVSIQTNENEPRRGGIVIPSKSAPIPQPKHSKWSVALDRPTPTKNFCLSVELQRQPPIRGAPHSTP